MLMILGFHRFGCPVAQGLVQALRVPPRDPPERRQFQVGQVGEWLAPPHQLGLVRAVGAFAMALSYGSPTVPVDGSIPYSITLVVYTVPVHCVPWSLWWIRPSVPPRDAAREIACSNACRQLLRVHGHGARPSHDPTGVHAVGERRAAERAVGHAHVGDVGHVQAVRRTSLEPPVHQIRPAARALGGFRRHRGFAAAHAPDAKPAHDVHHPVAADLRGIPALGDQLRVHLPAAVHGHEEIRVDLEDGAGQRLMPRPHAADGTCSEHAVAARREKPAVQRFGKAPADRPDPETASVLVDVRGHQRRAGSSLRPSRVTLTIGMYSKEGMPERSYHAARAYNQKWREEGIGEIRLVQTYKRTNVIFGLKKITLVRQWPYPASEPPYIKHFKTNEISEVTKIYISLLQHSTKKTAIYS